MVKLASHTIAYFDESGAKQYRYVEPTMAEQALEDEAEANILSLLANPSESLVSRIDKSQTIDDLKIVMKEILGVSE